MKNFIQQLMKLPFRSFVFYLAAYMSFIDSWILQEESGVDGVKLQIISNFSLIPRFKKSGEFPFWRELGVVVGRKNSGGVMESPNPPLFVGLLSVLGLDGKSVEKLGWGWILWICWILTWSWYPLIFDICARLRGECGELCALNYFILI